MESSVDVINSNDSETVENLIEIEKQAFGNAGLDQWTLVPLIRHGKVIALRYKNEIIGGAQFIRDWEDSLRAYLVGIAINSDYQGKGLGTRFLNGCLAILKDEGIGSVELTVDPSNKPAVRMYKDKLGFKTIETRKNEYGNGADRLVMERKL